MAIASPSTMLEMVCRICSVDMPSASSFACASSGCNTRASSLRDTRCESPQPVNTSDVAMAIAMVRTKFCKPAADAVSLGNTDPRVKVVSGIMKKGMAKPWTNCGAASVQKSTPLVQCARHSVIRPSQKTAPEIMMRGSTLPMKRATMGAIINAAMAVKAVTIPAQVAV